jgi:hypothetical protein
MVVLTVAAALVVLAALVLWLNVRGKASAPGTFPSLAIYAFLHSLEPLRQPKRQHALRFPGVSEWRTDEIAALLETEGSPRASATGPMVEVVYRSRQHLTIKDLRAMGRVPQAVAASGRHASKGEGRS